MTITPEQLRIARLKSGDWIAYYTATWSAVCRQPTLLLLMAELTASVNGNFFEINVEESAPCK